MTRHTSARKVFGGFGSICVMVCVLFCSISFSSWAGDKPIKLRYATTFPDSHFFTIADKNALKKIEQESNNRIKITIFAGGTLYKNQNSLDELKRGAADLGYVSSQYFPGFDLTVAQRAFWYGASNENSLRIYKDVLSKIPELESEWSDVKVLTRMAMGGPFHLLTTKKPIHSLADLRGLKIRSLPQMIEPLKAVGAEPISMPLGEVYIALEKGIIDGTFSPCDTLKGFAFHEVIKYVTRVNYYLGPFPMRAFNLKSWNKLPADIQKIFENNLAYWDAEIQRLAIEGIQKGVDAGKKAGVEFLEFESGELNKFYKYFEESATKEAKKLDAKGKPGSKLMQEIRTRIAKEI